MSFKIEPKRSMRMRVWIFSFISLVSLPTWAIPLPNCPTNGAAGNVRDLHRVVQIGQENRKLFPEWAREKRKRLSAVQRELSPNGLLNCRGLGTNGTLVSNNVILATRDSFFTRACEWKEPRNTCYFQPRGSDEQFKIDLNSLVTGCDGSKGGDWIVVKLEKSVPNAVTFSVPDSDVNLTVDQAVVMVSNQAQNFLVDGEQLPHVQECSIKVVNPVLYHDCDTGRGSSGSPLLTESRGGYTILAIHGGGSANHPDGTSFSSEHYNFATPLTGDFLKAVHKALGR